MDCTRHKLSSRGKRSSLLQQSERWNETDGGATRLTGGTPQAITNESTAIDREFFDFYRTSRGEFTPNGSLSTLTTYSTLLSNMKFMNFFPFNDVDTILPRPTLVFVLRCIKQNNLGTTDNAHIHLTRYPALMDQMSAIVSIWQNMLFSRYLENFQPFLATATHNIILLNFVMRATAASQKFAIPDPQSQSPFFNLARETRDDIYEYAFGCETISFDYRSLTIGASTKKSSEAIAYPGLPAWLLTCRAICSEALEAFFRTRYFSPRYRRAKYSTTPNSLLLHKESIRNIKVECPYSPYLLEADYIDPTHEAPFRMFLQAMQPYLAPELVLVIVWARYGQDWSVARELAMFENWPKRLRGMFRRVEIDVLVRREEDDEQYLKRMQNAEEFARKLIGDGDEGVRSSWGETKDLGIVSQKPCIRCGWVHEERVLREVRRLITLRWS